jgi:hypothetical protein
MYTAIANTVPVLLVSAVMILGSTGAPSAATFTGPVVMAVAPASRSSGLAPVADLNGDGVPDLVVADTGRSIVWVYFGAGHSLPTGPGVALPLPSYVTMSGVAVGDFDGDGVTDIVTTYPRGNYASVLYGTKDALTQNGNGTFTGPFNFVLGLSPQVVAAGPLRGSGNPWGLVAIGRGHMRGDRGGVAILVGSGGGGFATSQSITVGRRVRGVVLGDFGTTARDSRRDGNLDIAVTTDASVSIIYGDGAGNFGAPDTYSAGYAPKAIATGDFNNDGCSDLAATDNGHGSTVVLMLLGRCEGTGGSFAPPVKIANLPRGGMSLSITPLNLNGDGKLDLAVTRQRRTPGVDLLINNSDLATAPMEPRFLEPMLCAAGARPENVVAGSFNPDVDAIDDLVVATPRATTAGSNTNLAVLLGDGIEASCPTASEFALP